MSTEESRSRNKELEEEGTGGSSSPLESGSLIGLPRGIVEIVAENSTLNADALPYKSPQALRPMSNNNVNSRTTSPPPFGSSTTSIPGGQSSFPTSYATSPAGVSPLTQPRSSQTPAPKYKLETKEEMQARKSRMTSSNPNTHIGGGNALLGPSIGTGPGSSALVGTPSDPIRMLPPGSQFTSSPLLGSSSAPPTQLPPSVMSMSGSGGFSSIPYHHHHDVGGSSSNNHQGLPFQVPYDYILVLDFEATCEDPEPYGYTPEIIEFPIVVVSVPDGLQVAEFHSYVKPMVNTTLSPFCQQLTGIQQSDVDIAPTLDYVIERFQRWYHRTIPRGARVIFATDGPFDMRDFMYQHSVCKLGINFPPLFYTWIDVKSAFTEFFTCRMSKIEAMLAMLGMSFEGRVHSGIDDSRNIARIVTSLMTKGCTFATNVQRIPFAPDPTGNNGMLIAAAAAAAAAQQQHQHQHQQQPQAAMCYHHHRQTSEVIGEMVVLVSPIPVPPLEPKEMVVGGKNLLSALEVLDASSVSQGNATPGTEGATWAERVKGKKSMSSSTTSLVGGAGGSMTQAAETPNNSTASLPPHQEQHVAGGGVTIPTLVHCGSSNSSPVLQHSSPPPPYNNSLTTPPLRAQQLQHHHLSGTIPPPPPPPPPQGSSPPYHYHQPYQADGPGSSPVLVERVSPQALIAQQVAMMQGSSEFADLPPSVQPHSNLLDRR